MTEFDTVTELLNQVTRSLRVGVLVLAAIVGASLFSVMTDYVNQIDVAQMSLRSPRCCELIGLGPWRYATAIISLTLIACLLIAYRLCSSFLKDIKLLSRITENLSRETGQLGDSEIARSPLLSREQMVHQSYRSQAIYRLRDFSMILTCLFLLLAVPAFLWGVLFPLLQSIIISQGLKQFASLASTNVIDPVLFEGAIRFYIFQLVNSGIAVFLSSLLVVWSAQNAIKAVRINKIVAPITNAGIQSLAELDESRRFRLLRKHTNEVV